MAGTEAARSAEGAKSVYLLGSNAQLSGIAPPPGMYFYSLNYFYSGSANAEAADGVLLEDVGNIDLEAKLKVDSQAFITIPTILWAPQTTVFGGRVGFGVLAPVGWQEVNGRVDATARLTLPDGTSYSAGQTFKLSDETTAFGDPLLTAWIGWDSGNWHSKVTGLLNVPIGSYNKHDLANMGFNHWAFDASGAITWLDPSIGLEASIAAGFTFNAENPATDYRSGTEFHVEYALMQHFSEAFSAGVAGYYYDQISADSGKGATLGDFEGRVAAIGPNLTYNFQAGSLPVSTSLRWLYEFDAKNRLQGNSVFGTVTVPF
ncbi:MAG: transporter [Bauldia sp.]|nr:transporter [Bauldia sp.]